MAESPSTGTLYDSFSPLAVSLRRSDPALRFGMSLFGSSADRVAASAPSTPRSPQASNAETASGYGTPISPATTAAAPTSSTASSGTAASPATAASTASPAATATNSALARLHDDDLLELLGRQVADQTAATRDACIAIIDDEPLTVALVRKYLATGGYTNFVSTSDPTEALTLIARAQPDVVLLDVMMPFVSGLDILHAIASDETQQGPRVLMMTASSEARVREVCLSLGAADFLAKPIEPTEMVTRVRNTLVQKTTQDELANQNARLEDEVARRTAELVRSREEVVHCLARAAERRDDDTGHHVLRVGRYVSVIARRLGLSDEHAKLLELAAQLHDVGKIGIADDILFKPGRLDEQQIDMMRRHCALGRQIIHPLSLEEKQAMRTHPRLGSELLTARRSPLLSLASRIAQTHHERWDGTGYPLGLAGEDIPLEGRMTAVADVFDALASRRPYKEPFPREKCFAILEEGRGSHFCPRCLDAFFEARDEIVAIQIELMDDDAF